MGVAGEDACCGLAHHPLDTRHHLFELLAQTLPHRLAQDVGGRPLFGARGKLDAGADLFGEALRLAHNPAGRIQQFAVGLF